MGHIGKDQALLRLLEAAKEQLGAREARLELGGSPPSASTSLHVIVPPGPWRVVALFDEEPREPEFKLERLRALAEAFQGFLTRLHDGPRAPEEPRPSQVGSVPQTQLDEALLALADTTGALCAVVIDSASPVLWGRSHASLDVIPRGRAAGAYARLGLRVAGLGSGAEIAKLLELGPADCITALWPALVEADSDEELLRHALAEESGDFTRLMLAARAIAWARAELSDAVRESRLPLMRQVDTTSPCRYARGLSDLYSLALAFESPMSELLVDGAVRRATPHLERLLETIPPLEPPPVERGAKVSVLRRPRR